MFDKAPAEREAISWGYAVFWASLTFATVPYVRDAVDFVEEHWGMGVFTYAVGAAVVLALALAFYLTRQRWTPWSCLWLLGVAGLMIYLAFGLAGGSAVEAVHYVQYGTLSILLFRAFSHRVRDYSIYVAVTLTGTLVGMIDETIQWLSPGRFFDVRDIWLNCKATALVQIAVVAGIRPRLISGLPGWQSMKRLCYLGALTVAYFGLCLQNTPDRISWYSENVPGLGFIDPARSIMVEYGHLHGDAATVTFRSRLTTEDLLQSASHHAEDGALNFDDIHEAEQSGSFWRTHSRFANVFLYEGRVHQLRRDQFLARATESDDEDIRARHFAAAHWENLILKDHFSILLVGTRYEWTPEMEFQVMNRADLAVGYESNVSTHLIVTFNARQLAFIISAAVLILLALGYVFGRASRNAKAV